MPSMQGKPHDARCQGWVDRVWCVGQPDTGAMSCHAVASRRGMLGLPPSVVVLPEAVHEAAKQLLLAFEALDGGALECSFVPLSPGMCSCHLLMVCHACISICVSHAFWCGCAHDESY